MNPVSNGNENNRASSSHATNQDEDATQSVTYPFPLVQRLRNPKAAKSKWLVEKRIIEQMPNDSDQENHVKPQAAKRAPDSQKNEKMRTKSSIRGKMVRRLLKGTTNKYQNKVKTIVTDHRKTSKIDADKTYNVDQFNVLTEHRKAATNVTKKYKIFRSKRDADETIETDRSRASTHSMQASTSASGANTENSNELAVYEFNEGDLAQSELIEQQNELHERKPKQKIFVGRSSCMCKKKCAERINLYRQFELFGQYYVISKTWTERTKFLREHVFRIKKEKEYLNPRVPIKDKLYDYVYILSDENDDQQQVCMSFFTNLFQIDRNIIRNVIDSKESNPFGTDRRGKFPKKIVKTGDIEFIKKFIGEFQTYESQFRSSGNNKKNLHPKLNMIKLYRQYKDLCVFRKRKQVSRSFFEKIFRNDFDLRFFKDRNHKKCLDCRKMSRNLRESKDSEKREIKYRQLLHKRLVQTVNKSFAEDVKKAKLMEDNIEILTFEMCKPFDLPKILDYVHVDKKRQLWQYVMFIYDEVRNRSHVYTWSESVASKGSSEITSCLRKHLKENLSVDTKKLIIFSDPLDGQNRNLKISLMLKHFLNTWLHKSLQTIEQKYFLRGHAENKCNINFSLIEQQEKQTTDLYIPDDCFDVIEKSKKSHPRFFVTKMDKQDFLSLDPLVNQFNGTENWPKIKSIDLSQQQVIINQRSDPFTFKFKKYCSRKISAEVSLRIENVEVFPNIDLPILFPEGRAISELKFNDLQFLASKIPEQYRDYYNKLKFENEKESKDFALSLRESSDEEIVSD